MEKKTYKFGCGTGIYYFVFGARSYKDAIRIAEAKITERWKHNEIVKNHQLSWLHKFNTEKNVVIIPDGAAHIIFTPIY